jgi:hypothetical protein
MKIPASFFVAQVENNMVNTFPVFPIFKSKGDVMLKSVFDFSKRKGLKEAAMFYLFYAGLFLAVSFALGLDR